MFSTRAPPSLKTDHYSAQPSASMNNVIYATRYARGINHVTSHLFVMQLDITPFLFLFLLNQSQVYTSLHDHTRVLEAHLDLSISHLTSWSKACLVLQILL